jgi:hypothetical protein
VGHQRQIDDVRHESGSPPIAPELRKQQLEAINGRAAVGDGKVRRTNTLKGRKVAPHSRSKKSPNLTWSGRGATLVDARGGEGHEAQEGIVPTQVILAGVPHRGIVAVVGDIASGADV